MSLLALALLARAHAHHVVTDYAIASVEPRSYAGVTLELGATDGETWQLAALQAEYAVMPWLSLATRVPVARVEHAFGLADIDVSAKVRVYESEHGTMVSAGLGAELPTGDPHDHLGGGHLELDPFVVASTQAADDRLVFVGLVQQVTSFETGHEHGDDDAPEGLHGPPFSLHADYELRVEATAAAVFGAGWASLTLAPIVPWTEAPPAVELGGDGGINVGRANVALGFTVPVAGVPRFDWQARLNATVAF